MNEPIRGSDVAKASIETLLSMTPVAPLVPLLGLLSDRLVDRTAEEARSSYTRAIRVAARTANMTVEQLHDAIADDPRLVPAHARLLYFAARSGQTAPLRLMGYSLGTAANGQTDPDVAELMLEALERLSDRSVARLRAMHQEALDSHEASIAAGKAELDSEPSWMVKEPATPQAELEVAQLISAGLAATVAPFGGTAVAITRLGLAVLTTSRALENLSND